MSTYSLQNAARILKVAPSRLRYWKRTRLAVPSASAEAADLRRAAYEFRDLVGLRGVLSLLEQGISLQRIRGAVEVLRDRVPEIEDPLVALRLWAEGSDRMIVEHDGRWMEPDGQILLGFAMAESETVDGAVASLEAGEPTEVAETSSAGDHFERGCRLDADPATYDEAIEAYESALVQDPEFADAYCNLGAVFYNRGNREDARRHFERCLRLDSTHVESHFNLANLLEEEGCNEMALHHYRAGLSADPFYPDLHINLALLYEKMENPTSAHQHWRRYLQLEPEGSWSEVARLRLERD